MIDQKRIARRLRELREEKNLTQSMVAEKLFVTRQAVSSWELGSSLPSIDSCIMLMELYETTIDDLLCLKSVEVK